MTDPDLGVLGATGNVQNEPAWAGVAWVDPFPFQTCQFRIPAGKPPAGIWLLPPVEQQVTIGWNDRITGYPEDPDDPDSPW